MINTLSENIENKNSFNELKNIILFDGKEIDLKDNIKILPKQIKILVDVDNKISNLFEQIIEYEDIFKNKIMKNNEKEIINLYKSLLKLQISLVYEKIIENFEKNINDESYIKIITNFMEKFRLKVKAMNDYLEKKSFSELTKSQQVKPVQQSQPIQQSQQVQQQVKPIQKQIK